ncbi:MAG: hypothetical protein FWD78_09510 [Treponema sp.]|nr:hypothetical protein [Treponema sp.]
MKNKKSIGFSLLIGFLACLSILALVSAGGQDKGSGTSTAAGGGGENFLNAPGPFLVVKTL